ncbi:MAG: protein translocase subunit SecF [Pseudomonadota bacterium]
MFQFIKEGKEFKIIQKRKIFLVFSTLLVLASIIALFVFGLNFGIDFAGGTEMQIKVDRSKNASVSQIRDSLKELNLQGSSIQQFGTADSGEFLIRIESSVEKIDKIEAIITEKMETNLENFVSFKFRGGDTGYATFKDKVAIADIENAVKGANLGDEYVIDQVSLFGKETKNEYLVKFKGVPTKIHDTLLNKFGEGSVEVERVEMVGPKVGKELRQKGVYAVLVALFLILLYIAFRFDIAFAPGAVIALAHDVMITMGIFAVFQLDFSLQILAALLAIVGYSLNDTIVVYDRIRDNVKKFKGKELAQTINTSINQTLNRTILTSVTTLLVTVALLFLGGRILRDFALALTIGVLVGTYSSIYIASPIVLFVDGIRKKAKNQ